MTCPTCNQQITQISDRICDIEEWPIVAQKDGLTEAVSLDGQIFYGHTTSESYEGGYQLAYLVHRCIK